MTPLGLVGVGREQKGQQRDRQQSKGGDARNRRERHDTLVVVGLVNLHRRLDGLHRTKGGEALASIKTAREEKVGTVHSVNNQRTRRASRTQTLLLPSWSTVAPRRDPGGGGGASSMRNRWSVFGRTAATAPGRAPTSSAAHGASRKLSRRRAERCIDTICSAENEKGRNVSETRHVVFALW
jgi:hypothetical protein